MAENLFLELAGRGLRMPIGADLVLHEMDDPEALRHDGAGLGRVVEAAARRYNTPLAFPLMDLTLEKADLLGFFGVQAGARDAYHFAEPPAEDAACRMRAAAARPFDERMRASQCALRFIAGATDLLPVGMLIGPFSLMTKLVADPIPAVALAGAGITAEQDAAVLLVERTLALAEAAVERSARAQIDCGARAIIVCEPAANSVYISPRQMRSGSHVFETMVLGPNRRLKAILQAHGVDLIFHDCGELTAEMLRAFAAELRPAMLSLGSSRRLWQDAALLPKDIVLFGNLPTKTFYSDAAMPESEVRRLTGQLRNEMAAAGHPHILGSECDVLHVPEAGETIRRKVRAMLEA